MKQRWPKNDPLCFPAGDTYDLAGQYVASFGADFRALRDGRNGPNATGVVRTWLSRS